MTTKKASKTKASAKPSKTRGKRGRPRLPPEERKELVQFRAPGIVMETFEEFVESTTDEVLGHKMDRTAAMREIFMKGLKAWKLEQQGPKKKGN